MAPHFGLVVTPVPYIVAYVHFVPKQQLLGLEGVEIPLKAAHQPSPYEVFMAAGWILGT